jgi:2-hydroxychromene-2-carboxylate isomerase
MPKTLDFSFDLVSPYSYLASLRVEGIAQKGNAHLRSKSVFVVDDEIFVGHDRLDSVERALSLAP